MYQRSPYTHFVHTDSIKIFDPNSQIFKQFTNDTIEQQNLEIITQSSQTVPLSLPSSPSSPSNLDETFSTFNFNKEAIQSLVGPTVYNQGSNLLSSCTIDAKLETSTTTLTSSIMGSNLMTLNRPLWFIGRVTHKEFCIARKANNRYRVPTGSQFYRVRIHPFKV